MAKRAKWADNFIKPEEAKEVIAERSRRAGVCDTCNKGSFTLVVHEHKLLRLCKNCKEVYNPDTDKIVRKGVIE